MNHAETLALQSEPIVRYPRAAWRERSAARLARDPSPAEWTALQQSLEALFEAVVDEHPFSWACSPRHKSAAQDYCLSRAFRRPA